MLRFLSFFFCLTRFKNIHSWLSRCLRPRVSCSHRRARSALTLASPAVGAPAREVPRQAPRLHYLPGHCAVPDTEAQPRPRTGVVEAAEGARPRPSAPGALAGSAVPRPVPGPVGRAAQDRLLEGTPRPTALPPSPASAKVFPAWSPFSFRRRRASLRPEVDSGPGTRDGHIKPVLVVGGVAGPRRVSALVASPAGSVRGRSRVGCWAGTFAAAGAPLRKRVARRPRPTQRLAAVRCLLTGMPSRDPCFLFPA